MHNRYRIYPDINFAVSKIEPGVKNELYFTSFVPYLYKKETETKINNTKNKIRLFIK